MWRAHASVILAFAAAVACGRAPEARQYDLRGQILAVDRERREVLVDHEDIAGFMPAVLAFAKRFGVTAQPADPDIGLVHNLRTAIIDPQGRLVTAYSGTMWTPAELVADLRKAPAPAH